MNLSNQLQLSDINLSALKLVKETCQWIQGQDHSRWVFYDPKRGHFLKIWNPTYLRRDHLLRGLESGFYDETTIPAFQTLIVANGMCRGYVMQKCYLNRKMDPLFHARILEQTARTGFFIVQYSRYHTMRFGEALSLVDLEAIHPLEELPLMPSYYHCFFDDREYEEYVIHLYRRAFPHLPAPLPTREMPPSISNFSRYRKIQSVSRSLYRKLLIRLQTIFNHVERIES